MNARQLALKHLTSVLRDHHILDTSHEIQTQHHRDKALAHMIVITVLQHMGDIDFILKEKLSQPLAKMNQQTLVTLRMAIAQLVYLKLPPYAVVNEHVSLAKHHGQKKLINAVLRSVIREKWSAKTYDHHYNLPRWLYGILKESFSKQEIVTISQMLYSKVPLDICLHPNIWHQTESLATQYDALMLCDGALRFYDYQNFFTTSLWQSGQCWVQDIAAQLPVRLLNTKNHHHVIDACAAPGGKLMQLASAGLQCRAIDISNNKAVLLLENLNRIHHHADIIIEDFLHYHGDKADAILLDAPCSAIGTIRRHPELKYIKSKQDILRLCHIQRNMLKKAADLLDNGGHIIFSVCTLSNEETISHCEWVKNNIPSLDLLPFSIDELPDIIDFDKKSALRHGCVLTAPHMMSNGGMDGFFIARFLKK